MSMLWKNISDERWTQGSNRTEARDAVHALAEASELLRASSDAMLDPQAVLEAVTGPSGDVVDFVFRDTNKACCDYIGRSRTKLLERSMLSVFPNVFTSGLLTHFARCATDGVPVVLDDFQYIDEVTGEEHHFDIRAAQVRTGMITLLVRDVGERFASMRLLELARESERQADARFRRLMATSGVGTCLATPDGKIDAINQALCDFFGYDSETLRAKTWQDLTPADSPDDDLRNTADLVSGRVEERDRILAGEVESYRIVKRFIHADGRLLWGDLSVSCLRDADGRVETFIKQIIDVTETVEAHERIAALNQRLTDELQSAATYIASIMPSGLAGEASVTSRFLPSRELGGDCFDYYWVDDDHLVVYLIDVSGHGIEPALLAVSVQNVLRSGTIPIDILRDPAAVLTELNRLFQMEQQGDHFFTVWYGVYDRATRTLRYASAGAPPAYAFTTEEVCVATELVTRSEPVGAFAETRFTSAEFPVPSGCQVLIYSDGASEIALPGGGQLPHEKFRALVTRVASSPHWTLDELVDQLRGLTAHGVFHDDMSLIRLAFD